MAVLNNNEALYKIKQASRLLSIWSPWWLDFLSKVEFDFGDNYKRITGLSSMIFPTSTEFLSDATPMDIAVQLEFALQQASRRIDIRSQEMKYSHPNVDEGLIGLATSLEINSDMYHKFESITQYKWEKLARVVLDESYIDSFGAGEKPSLPEDAWTYKNFEFPEELKAESYLKLLIELDEKRENEWLNSQEEEEEWVRNSSDEPDEGTTEKGNELSEGAKPDEVGTPSEGNSPSEGTKPEEDSTSNEGDELNEVGTPSEGTKPEEDSTSSEGSSSNEGDELNEGYSPNEGSTLNEETELSEDSTSSKGDELNECSMPSEVGAPSEGDSPSEGTKPNEGTNPDEGSDTPSEGTKPDEGSTSNEGNSSNEVIAPNKDSAPDKSDEPGEDYLGRKTSGESQDPTIESQGDTPSTSSKERSSHQQGGGGTPGVNTGNLNPSLGKLEGNSVEPHQGSMTGFEDSSEKGEDGSPASSSDNSQIGNGDDSLEGMSKQENTDFSQSDDWGMGEHGGSYTSSHPDSGMRTTLHEEDTNSNHSPSPEDSGQSLESLPENIPNTNSPDSKDYVCLSKDLLDSSDSVGRHEMSIPRRPKNTDKVGVDASEMENISKDLAESIKEYMDSREKSPGGSGGYGVGQGYIEWSQKKLHKPKASWKKVFPKMLTSNMGKSLMSGVSDMTYAKRNPNQRDNMPLMMGFVTYPPHAAVLIDASPSMYPDREKVISEFTSISAHFFMRYGDPISIFVADNKIQFATRTVTVSKRVLNHATRTYMGGSNYGHNKGDGFGGTMEKILKGKAKYRGSGFPKPGILVVFTDGEFEWPYPNHAKLPQGCAKVIIVCTRSFESLKNDPSIDLPKWVKNKINFVSV